jgi:primosomal protein N'
MYILSVIPISRGIPFNTLTYYSSDSVATGTVVEIPLGKQAISGLVFACTSLIEAKTSIKQATFSLKKIKRVIGTSSYTTALVEGLCEASTKTLTPIGALAGIVVNELFFDLLSRVSDPVPAAIVEPSSPALSYGSKHDRTDHYKRIIRTSFAEKKSVLLVAPSIRSVEYWFATLQKGITAHSVILHSKKTKKDQRAALTTIKSSDRPLFICTTPQNASIPRSDVRTIIVEDESSNLYKLHDRYGADMRIVVECLARALRVKLVFGDTLPRFESMVKAGMTHLARSFTPENVIVVPIERYRTILPAETIELIRYCQKHKKTMLIYTNRKGLAPISRCTDCGTTVDCPTCGLPIVLRYKVINGERERLFICTNCGDTLAPTHSCTHCSSWNITPISVGTESVYDAVAAIIGKEHVVVIDDDTTPDTKEVEQLLTDVQKRKWYVMVGTQKLLPYIKHVDYSVFPFFDRLLSIPSPYTLEDTLRLIMECSEKTQENLVLCTTQPDFPITKSLATKKLQEVIDTDLQTREALRYPPYGMLIKLSVTVPSAHIDTVRKKIQTFFEGFDMTLLPPRRITAENMRLLSISIIQVPTSYLEDYRDDLENFLQDLRFPYGIDINPSRLS